MLPELRFLGTVGLALGAFDLGWKVGTGLNTKLLKIGIPAGGDHGTDYCSGTCPQRLTYTTSLTPFPDWAGPDYPSSEGGVFAWQWTICSFSCQTRSTRQVPDGGGPACDGDPSIPSSLHVITAMSAGTRCSATPVTTQAGYLLPSELGASAPVDDYTDQPYDVQTTSWPDAPTSQDQLKTRVRAGFEGGEYPFAEAWYAHQLDPQTYEDPTAEDDEQLRDCRPDDQQPAGDPAPLRGTQDFLQDPDRWRARYDTVPESEFPPGSAVPEDGLPATGGRAYMRWGWTSLNAEKPWLDWEGWGYRKIVAKHGWGPTALARTQEALLTIPLSNGGYDLYLSPDTYAGRSGKTCEWVVVVQRDPRDDSYNPELSQQAPMGGIITAHGRYVRSS